MTASHLNATSTLVSRIVVTPPSPHFWWTPRGRQVFVWSRRVGLPHLVLRNDLADCGAEPGVARFPRMGFIGSGRRLETTCREQGRCLEDRPGNSYNLSALVALGAPRHSAIIAPSAASPILLSWLFSLAV